MRKFLICVLLLLLTLPAGLMAQDSSSNNNPEQQVTQPGQGQIASVTMPPDQISNDMLAKVKTMRAELQKMTRERKFPQAHRKLAAIDQLLKKSRILDNKVKNSLIASVQREEALRLHSAEGEYAKAANAVRAAIKYDAQRTDKELLLKTQEKVGKQNDWFKVRVDHEKSMTRLFTSKTPLLKEKLEVLRKMDTKKKLSDADLKKMQEQLKKINQKLKTVNSAIKEQRESFAKAAEQRKKDRVILTAAQHKKLFPLSMRKIKARFTNYGLHKEIARHLANIAENTEVTWKDLKKNFESIQKLQEEIWSLRKRLLVLADKSPMTDADYSAAKEIREKLERAMNKAEAAMGKIESAFIDAKTFNKLSAKEKLEFVKLLRDVWSRDKEFASLKPSLEEIYEKIFESEPIRITDPLPEPVEPQPEPVIEPQPEPEPKPDTKLLEGKGKIILEGNTYVLVVNDSNNLYYPINLPKNYMVDRLEVVFVGEVLRSTIEERNAQTDTPGHATDQSPAQGQAYEWWEKLPRISLVRIHAPQLPDEPFEPNVEPNKPGQVIEENIDNQDRPANLLNAF